MANHQNSDGSGAQQGKPNAGRGNDERQAPGGGARGGDTQKALRESEIAGRQEERRGPAPEKGGTGQSGTGNSDRDDAQRPGPDAPNRPQALADLAADTRGKDDVQIGSEASFPASDPPAHGGSERSRKIEAEDRPPT